MDCAEENSQSDVVSSADDNEVIILCQLNVVYQFEIYVDYMKIIRYCSVRLQNVVYITKTVETIKLQSIKMKSWLLTPKYLKSMKIQKIR